jgi:hypothetical protein
MESAGSEADEKADMVGPNGDLPGHPRVGSVSRSITFASSLVAAHSGVAIAEPSSITGRKSAMKTVRLGVNACDYLPSHKPFAPPRALRDLQWKEDQS